MFAQLINVLMILALVAGVPVLAYYSARKPEVRSLPRLDLYLSAVFSQWSLTLVCLGGAYFAARRVLTTGFGPMPLLPFLKWTFGVAALALVVQGACILGEHFGWLPPESDLVHRLMPRTAREKFWAVLIVAPTAAFCEEFLYRGYLLTQFRDGLHSLLWAWVISSAAFGLAHFYQGWNGMIRAAVLGALLVWPVAHWGCLYPAMLAHWLFDAIALMWLGKLLNPESEAPGPESREP